jgi:hypothetical protein
MNSQDVFYGAFLSLGVILGLLIIILMLPANDAPPYAEATKYFHEVPIPPIKYTSFNGADPETPDDLDVEHEVEYKENSDPGRLPGPEMETTVDLSEPEKQASSVPEDHQSGDDDSNADGVDVPKFKIHFDDINMVNRLIQKQICFLIMVNAETGDGKPSAYHVSGDLTTPLTHRQVDAGWLAKKLSQRYINLKQHPQWFTNVIRHLRVNESLDLRLYMGPQLDAHITSRTLLYIQDHNLVQDEVEIVEGIIVISESGHVQFKPTRAVMKEGGNKND